MNKDYTEEYIDLLKKKIKDLELEIINLKFTPVTTGYVQPVQAYCQHEYPQAWGGIYPPSCVKCGRAVLGYGPTITCNV